MHGRPVPEPADGRSPGIACVTARILRADRTAVTRAARMLAEGRLVAFPTETVYGLGADAGNATAVAQIFEAKRRPADHPLIVHVADLEAAHRWAFLSAQAVALAEAFWPGPLTLIVPRAGHVHDIVTGGQPSVGLRVPSHPVAHALLMEFGNGIAAPSANRFGHVSPTTARHVADDLEDAVDLILDGGASDIGIESTIVALTTDTAMLLRLGGIGADAIAGVLGHPLAQPDSSAPARRERWRRTTRRERLRISSTTMSCVPSSRNSRIATSASPCLHAQPSRPKRSTACGSPLRSKRPSTRECCTQTCASLMTQKLTRYSSNACPTMAHGPRFAID